MKLLCKQLAGSHSYGLSTPESDTDYRGVYVCTDYRDFIGLGKNEFHQPKTGDDEFYTEYRNGLKLLRSGNTQMVELLYAKDFLELTDEWRVMQLHRHNLLDSETLFNCLRGYIQGEKKLANGERTGKLGGKRKAAIERYGFSPKNFVQLFRLAWAGITYFDCGVFPVNVLKREPAIWHSLMEIKTHPERYNKEELSREADEWEAKLVNAYENRKVSTVFDEDLANELCLRVYGPMVSQELTKIDLCLKNKN